MHNEYITLKCIQDERSKLLLLKYADTDITNVSDLLHRITLNLMDQCYEHVERFDNANSYANKNYAKMEDLVLEQLKDMTFVKKKFIEYFLMPGKKTKEDLLTYVFGFQIPSNYYNQYIYAILIDSLKNELTLGFWNKYDLSRFEIDTDFAQDFYILNNTKEECSTGRVKINVGEGTKIFDKYATDRNVYRNIKKLELVKQVALTLDNYYNKDFPCLNTPYKDSTLDLVDHIKVYKDYEKPIQFVKRI